NIQCNVAQYNYKEEFLVLNSQEVLDKVENNIKIVPLTEKWNMKLCKAKSAKVDIQKDKVYLIGDVEITF
ncbi:MAG: hypothetical protein N2511_08620, partial [Thermodesulfovibrionales bacterium]|nr:hypothetical protein [Thermodesulfovibrionales bacterium]